MIGRENVPALQQTLVLECIWTDCPEEVSEEARKIWQDYEYGNDHYYYSWYWGEDEERYPAISAYLKEKGVEPETKVLIHWWW